MMNLGKLALVAGLLLAAAPALAQTDETDKGGGMMGSGGGGMGHGGGMMGRMGHGVMMDENDVKAMVEGRLAYIKTALGITADQAEAWKAYEDAARANGESMQTAHAAMMKAMGDGTAMEHMQAHIAMMQARLDALKALQPATEALYKALTPDQQKKADQLLGMGGGMM
jgi:LTXXQ motif family protein